MNLFLRGLLVFMGVSIARTCLAGQYELVEGAGVDVCEAYRRNLEPRHDEKPMACERQYDAAIPGFASPPWRRLDVLQNISLYREAVRYLATSGFSAQGMSLSEAGVREAVDETTSRAKGLDGEMYLATVDLGRDGHRVNILAIRERGCGPQPDPVMKISRLFVLDSSMRRIDLAKQISLRSWYNNTTVEFFEGRPYIESYVPDDNWGHLFTGVGELHVARFALADWPDEDAADAERRPAAPIELCRIRFTPSPKTGNQRSEE